MLVFRARSCPATSQNPQIPLSAEPRQQPIYLTIYWVLIDRPYIGKEFVWHPC